jgi:hypothetical protein
MPTKRAMAAEIGLVSWLVPRILEDGEAVIFQPARLPKRLIDTALRALPKYIRDHTAKLIADARAGVQSEMQPHGPLSMTELHLGELRSRARVRPSLRPIVAILERQSLRNEMALLRYLTARQISWMPKPAERKLDPFSPEGVEAIYAHRREMTSNPAARACHNQPWHLDNVVRWTERAVVALHAGRDVAQAYSAKLAVVSDANDGLAHTYIDRPRSRIRQEARERHAAERPALEARDARLRAQAAELRQRHPTWSNSAIAQHLAKSNELAPRTIRRVISSVK